MKTKIEPLENIRVFSSGNVLMLLTWRERSLNANLKLMRRSQYLMYSKYESWRLFLYINV